MKGGDFVVCPACQTRNKKTWEFCVRCGESLEGAAAEQKAAAAGGEAQASWSDEFSWRGVVGTLLLLALGVAGFVYIRHANVESPPPTAGIFAAATTPSSLPKPPPQAEPQGPGAAQYLKGRQLLREGKAKEAAAFLAQAVAADGSSALFHSLYGEALTGAGEAEQALGEYRQAADLEPDRYRLQLAKALNLMGRVDEALAEYEALAGAAPENAALALAVGNLCYRAGKFDKALPFLQQAAKANPRDMVLQQELGYAVERSGNAQKAIEIYSGILAQAPEAAVTRTQLATVLEKQGKSDEAAALLREGIQQNPSAPGLRAGLAGVLERKGRSREAAAEYREAARLAEGTPEAEALARRADALEQKAGGGQ